MLVLKIEPTIDSANDLFSLDYLNESKALGFFLAEIVYTCVKIKYKGVGVHFNWKPEGHPTKLADNTNPFPPFPINGFDSL